MGAIPILVIAVAQGWLLYALHYSIQSKHWPATEVGWLLALYAVALFVPTALQILAGHLRERLTWLVAVVVTLMVGSLGGYAGWTLGTLSDNAFNFGFLLALYGALLAAWFIALPFVQARLRGGTWRVAYPDLFEFGWQNALVLGEAMLFTGVFRLLLLLWAQLFKVIGISFFSELFAKPVFVYPASSVVFGYAIYLIESNEKIVAALRRHLLGVFSWLLPLVMFIALLFLLALPFTGLEPLWRTGHATTLMLWLQVLFVHFINSAYQDGLTEPRYPSWLKFAARIAVLALPIYAVLSTYSLGLRVHQHGWTVARVWAAIATFLAALYGIGYAVAALRRSPWMGNMARVNVMMAGVVAAALLLAVSPILDPKRITAESQLARLRSGRILPTRFDYDYFRFELARYGRDALAELAKDSNNEIARPSAAALAKARRYDTSAPTAPEAVASRIELFPRGAKLDPTFLTYLQDSVKERPGEHPGCLRTTGGKPCVMLALDLNGDGQPEILSLGNYPMAVYAKAAGGWKKVGNLSGTNYDLRGVEDLLRDGKASTEPHPWRDVVIGSKRYSVHPTP